MVRLKRAPRTRISFVHELLSRQRNGGEDLAKKKYGFISKGGQKKKAIAKQIEFDYGKSKNEFHHVKIAMSVV